MFVCLSEWTEFYKRNFEVLRQLSHTIKYIFQMILSWKLFSKESQVIKKLFNHSPSNFWTNQSIGNLCQSIGKFFLSQPTDWNIKPINLSKVKQLTKLLRQHINDLQQLYIQY